MKSLTRLVFLLGLFSASWAAKAIDRADVLKVAMRMAWALPLHPATQHTLAEDAVIAYEFEPLLTRGNNGLIEGVAAKSFEFNKDFTVYTFVIDTTHRFSDGTRLTAQHFKDSWERGLLKDPNSSNPNQEDALSQVVGFDDFQKTKTLSGLKVIGDDTLEVHFKKPFRLALVYLSGGRFAAYIEKDGKPIGTNKYRLESATPTKLSFTRNPFYHNQKNGFDVVEISYYKEDDEVLSALREGKVDVLAFNTRIIDPSNVVGSTTTHVSRSLRIDVNGINGRFFASKEMRQAFQALVWQILREKKDIEKATNRLNFELDPQPYAKLQAGRIEPPEAMEIVRRGEAHIPKLLEAAKTANLRFYFKSSFAFMADELKKKGLAFTAGEFSTPTEALEDYYKNFKSDATTSGASFYNSDPDGLYHVLGRHGAITSPVIQREPVAELMEQGRTIFGQDDIAKHYSRVTRTILEEVPYVHIGFGFDNHLYRSDRIALVNSRYTELHSDVWNIFEPLPWYRKIFK
jgi:ABC-type transport system substrate-binding protein